MFGLVDCYMYIVFGGDCVCEFEMWLEGVLYEEIVCVGGGILFSVNVICVVDDVELLVCVLFCVDYLIVEGVIMLEIKLGYGLIVVDEMKMLWVVWQIGEKCVIYIKIIWLVVYVLFVEYKDDCVGYICDVVIVGMDVVYVEGLIDVVDGFCEGIVFSCDEMVVIFDYVYVLGLLVKLYVEQLLDLYGVVMVVGCGVILVDYLEWLGQDGIDVMVVVGMVVVLLLGVFYMLCEIRLLLVQVLCDVGVFLVLVIDSNLGILLLILFLLMMNMGVILFCMMFVECLVGVIVYVVCVLGLLDCGILVVGQCVDLVIWNVDYLVELIYCIGFNLFYVCIFGGDFV